ncbi:hypothetical protein AB0E96_26540 [Kitasatospora sp. NPDC036755]|uniref:hypothetical protein n=1 Tax=Kitasatospora sp. NPDC036755 TaxID=3154600 RepID=UPI00340BEF43
MRPTRTVVIGRTLRSLVTEPRNTLAWLWGVHLQFTWPVTMFSPHRRQLARRFRLRRKLDAARAKTSE